MTDAPATPMTDAELLALLHERARRLQPSPALIDRALARCVRADLRRATAEALTIPESQRLNVSGPGALGLLGVPALPTSAVTEVAEPDVTAADTLQPAAAAPVGDNLPSGRIIAGYRIEGPLGKGGMGQVYRATQLSMGRVVAFKVLIPRLANDPAFRERFLREARAAGRFHHANLIAVHDVGEANGQMFFSMELVEGRTLKARLAEGPVGVAEAGSIARQALAALAYAHARGVIHRDIKPDNLMLTADGTVKIADLGLSRLEADAALPDDQRSHSGATDSTQAGILMGTPQYMSPEQARDAHRADHRTDLWSLGATLYHLVCGVPPFTGKTAVELLMKAATQLLRWPEPGPDPRLRAFIERLLAKNPSERPASAEAALALADDLLNPRMPSARLRPALRRARRRRRVRRVALWAALLATAFVLFAILSTARANARASDAWQRTSTETQASAEHFEFAAAVATATAARDRLSPNSGRWTRANDLVQQLNHAWDDWARQKSAASLTEIDAHLKDRRFTDAAKALKAIPETWLSPAVRAQLDARQEQLEDALLHLAEQPPAPTDTAQQVQNKQLARERNQRLVGLFWERFNFSPTTGFTYTDGVSRFTGSGAGRMVMLPVLMSRELELRVHFADDPATDERWRFDIGTVGLILDRRGLSIETPGQSPRTVRKLGKNTAIFRLRRTAEGFALRASDDAGWEALPASATAGLAIGWHLNAGQAVDVTLRQSGRGGN